MKIKLILPVLFALFPFFMKAQITVTCDSYKKVGLGINNTSPVGNVDVLGEFYVRPSSSYSYAKFTSSSTYGWMLGSSSLSTGYIGYYGYLYGLRADYVYASNIVYSSDERLKENIQPLYSALPLIKKLRPVTFDYNIDHSKVENANVKAKLEKDDKNRLGFIAQDVQKLLPQTVKEREADSMLCIQLTDFIPLLVKGMQEQIAQIDSLKLVIEEMKASDTMVKSAIVTGRTESSLLTQAKLYQNNPNPFTENTIVKCFIPAETTLARLHVFNMQGVLMKTFEISGRNQTEVTISGAEFNPGMYIYSLVLDNREIDSKRMILTE